MKLKRVEIENYRAVEKLDLTLDPDLTVFHGANGHGKTSVLSAIAVASAAFPRCCRTSPASASARRTGAGSGPCGSA